MPYEIYWEVPDSVLLIKLLGHVSLDDFYDINEGVLDYLDRRAHYQRIAVVVETNSAASVPQQFQNLKASQTFVESDDVRWLLVSANNKFLRLMMLLTYNLSKPSLHFFDSVPTSLNYLRHMRHIDDSHVGSVSAY